MNKNPKLNSEGYYDPTAYEGLKPIIKEESQEQKRVTTFIGIIKGLAEMFGLKIVGRVIIKDKKSGKEYR